MENIDIEKIMEEIRQEIKEKGYKESDLSFSDIPITDQADIEESYNEQVLLENIRGANQSTRVDFYKPIDGGIKGLIKKIIRKMVKPIILHLCQEQEIFNAYTVRTINQLYSYNKQLEKRIEDLEKIIEKNKIVR